MKTSIRSRLPVVIEYAHVHAGYIARRVQPPMIVAEIDANGISGEHDQILGDQRAVADIIFMRPRARNSGELFGSRIVHPNAMRLSINDKQAVLRIKCNRARICEVDCQRRPIAGESESARPHNRIDDPGLHLDLADAIASGVTDIQITLGVKRHIKRQI